MPSGTSACSARWTLWSSRPGPRRARVRPMERPPLHRRRPRQGAQAPVHGRPERRPAQSGPGRCLQPPPRTRQAGQGRADRRHAQADCARQQVAEGGPRVDASGPLPERKDTTASRRAQSPAQGADRTSATTLDTLPRAPHDRRHASLCTRYGRALRLPGHSGCTRSPTVHAHICTHYPASPIISPTTCLLRPERLPLDRTVLVSPEKRRTDA